MPDAALFEKTVTQKANGINGILLAAGSSTRFGSDKLLYRLPDGTPMAVAAASNLQPACDHVVAVLRHDQNELACLLAATGCELTFCDDAKGGMGHSLAAGVQATNNAFAWIVALGDMPFIKSTTHQTVAQHLRSGASLVASQYQEHRGHPVGFSGKWFEQLIAMTGDQGGKSILEQNLESVILCQIDDPGVIRDFDYQEDLKNVPRLATYI